MTLEIRRLKYADKKEWKGLWSAYIEFYESTIPEEIYQLTFDRLLDPERPQQEAFVAEHDGHLVGLVHIIYHAHNWHLEDVCYLQDLYVKPSARGVGVGRALIEAVYAVADGNGTHSVYWLTQNFNETARRLYERVAHLTDFVKYQR